MFAQIMNFAVLSLAVFSVWLYAKKSRQIYPPMAVLLALIVWIVTVSLFAGMAGFVQSLFSVFTMVAIIIFLAMMREMYDDRDIFMDYLCKGVLFGTATGLMWIVWVAALIHFSETW